MPYTILERVKLNPIDQEKIDKSFKEILAEEMAKYKDQDEWFKVTQEDLCRSYNT